MGFIARRKRYWRWGRTPPIGWSCSCRTTTVARELVAQAQATWNPGKVPPSVTDGNREPGWPTYHRAHPFAASQGARTRCRTAGDRKCHADYERECLCGGCKHPGCSSLAHCQRLGGSPPFFFSGDASAVGQLMAVLTVSGLPLPRAPFWHVSCFCRNGLACRGLTMGVASRVHCPRRKEYSSECRRESVQRPSSSISGIRSACTLRRESWGASKQHKRRYG